MTTWIDPEGITLSEISQTERQILFRFHLCVKSKKQQMSKHKLETITGTEKKQVVA